MAVKAFILIEAVEGRNMEVVTALKQLDGVKSAVAVTGPYDVIAAIEGEIQNDIGNLIFEIHAICGISRTVTCLVV